MADSETRGACVVQFSALFFSIPPSLSPTPSSSIVGKDGVGECARWDGDSGWRGSLGTGH